MNNKQGNKCKVTVKSYEFEVSKSRCQLSASVHKIPIIYDNSYNVAQHSRTPSYILAFV